MHKLYTTFLLLASLGLCPPLLAKSLGGRVVEVVDGDTLVLKDIDGKLHTVDLIGIDAPELKQAYGPEARAALQQLVNSTPEKLLTVDAKAWDLDGHEIALVHPGVAFSPSLNFTLVKNGHAWADLDNANTLFIKAERHARTRKLGLWQAAQPTPPWQWRAKNETLDNVAPGPGLRVE